MPRIPCEYCSITFARPYGASRHQKQYHNQRFVQENPSPAACQYCAAVLADKDSLRRHRKRFHSRHPTPPLDSILIRPDHATYRHPCRVSVAGATGTGKTAYMADTVLKGRIQPPPQRIVLICRYHQAVYDQLRNVVRHMEIHTEIPTTVRWSRPGMRTLVILDDVMDTVYGNKEVCKIFTGGSRHADISIFILQQDCFPEGRHAVTDRKNLSHLVLTDTGLGRGQVLDLARSVMPLTPKAMYEAYEEVMKGSCYPKFIIDGSVRDGVCARRFYSK